MSERYHKYGPNSYGHNVSLSDRHAFGGVQIGQNNNINTSNGYNETTYTPNNYINYNNQHNYANQDRYNDNNPFIQKNVGYSTYRPKLGDTYYLSPAERDVIQNSPMLNSENRQYLQKLMKKGDIAKKEEIMQEKRQHIEKFKKHWMRKV